MKRGLNRTGAGICGALLVGVYFFFARRLVRKARIALLVLWRSV